MKSFTKEENAIIANNLEEQWVFSVIRDLNYLLGRWGEGRRDLRMSKWSIIIIENQ